VDCGGNTQTKIGVYITGTMYNSSIL